MKALQDRQRVQGVQRKIIQVAAFGFTNSHIGNLIGGNIYKGSDEFYLCCKREQDGNYHILTLNSKGVYWVPVDYAILKSYINGEKVYLKGMEPKEDKK